MTIAKGIAGDTGVSGTGGLGQVGGPTFDPWNPMLPAVAKSTRTLIADYTFGTATSALLGSPITNLTQLNNNFWNMLNFNAPIFGSNGTQARYLTEGAWQTYVGTTNMSLESTDLLIQGKLNALVTTNTALGNLMQTSVTANNVAANGTFTWTIATGLDWQAGDPVAIDGSADATGTITSYTSGTGALVINVTNVITIGSGSTWTILRQMLTTGIIRSKQTFLYGFFEAMISVPPGNGMGTQFWLYTNDPTAHGGSNCEIDILEQIVNVVAVVDGTWSWSNFHAPININPSPPLFDLRSGTQLNGGVFTYGSYLWHHPNFDITSGFHKFQCLWVPGYVAFYVDDIPFLVASMNWKTNQGPLTDFAGIILNFAIGLNSNNFMGVPNDITNYPANLKCQYIRVWQSAAETAIGAFLKSK